MFSLLSGRSSAVATALVITLALCPRLLLAQSSSQDGPYDANATWAGNVAPSGWASVNIYHNVSYTSDHSVQGTLNIYNGGSLTLTNTSLGVSGGSVVQVHNGGILVVDNLGLNGYIYVHPGGQVLVRNTVFIFDSDYLYLGDNTGGTTYADMVIQQSLVYSGGKATIRSNGRLAIYGNISGNSNGGTIFQVNNGGQVYVHGDLSFVGGGDAIVNHNSVSPFGLYINGVISNTGGGATTSPNTADQQEMFSSNPVFADWVVNAPGSPVVEPLPVKLVNFTAQAYPYGIVLRWQTAWEDQNSHFVLEHSADGLNWHTLQQITGFGTTNQTQNYRYEHLNPLAGLAYYRLQQLDADGTATVYPPLPVVWLAATNKLTVGPNPATDYIVITLPATETTGMVVMHTLQGRLVAQSTLKPGTNTLAVQHLSRGAYVLRASGPQGLLTNQKIILK